jgi:TonB family protein
MDRAIEQRISPYPLGPGQLDTLVVRVKISKSGEVKEALVSKAPADQNPRIPEATKIQITEAFLSLTPLNPATCGGKPVESFRVLAVVMSPPTFADRPAAPPQKQEPKIQEQELRLDSLDLSDGGPAVPDFDTQDDSVYAFPEVSASFPGGEQALLQYMVNNTFYPKAAKEGNIQGTVYVSFVVGRDGRISDVKVKKGIGHGLDEEVLKMVKRMPNWKPAQNNGKNVASSVTLPVKFKLSK